MNLAKIFITSFLIDNVVVMRFIALCPFIGMSSDKDKSIVYAIGVALGFLLAMLLLAGIRERIRTNPIPAFLKGQPILFVCTCLLSMAFMGFSSLTK